MHIRITSASEIIKGVLDDIKACLGEIKEVDNERIKFSIIKIYMIAISNVKHRIYLCFNSCAYSFKLTHYMLRSIEPLRSAMIEFPDDK